MNAMLSYAVENRNGLVRFCCARGVYPEDAEDVVHDVICKLLRAKSPRDASHPKAYVLRVIKNELTDRATYQKRVHLIPIEEEERRASSGVEHDAEVNEALAEVRDVLADTSSAQREGLAAFLAPDDYNQNRHRIALFRLRKKLRAARTGAAAEEN